MTHPTTRTLDRTATHLVAAHLGWLLPVLVDGRYTGNPGPIHGRPAGAVFWLGAALALWGTYRLQGQALDRLATSPSSQGIVAASAAMSYAVFTDHAMASHVFMWTVAGSVTAILGTAAALHVVRCTATTVKPW